MKKILYLTAVFAVTASGGEIRLAPDASDAEKFAANDLEVYYRKVTGQTLTAKDCPLIVHIGKAARQTAWFKPSPTAFEEWILQSNGNELVITGDTRGTVWGVYRFIEQHLGCAFLAPDTTMIPSRPGWKLPAIAERGKPAFFRRALDGSPRVHPAAYRLRRRESILTYPETRLHHGSPGGNHTHAAYTKSWPSDAPFARTAGGGVWKSTFCLSSPRAVELIAAQMRRFIELDRKNRPREQWPLIYDLSQNDGSSAFCQCPRCAAQAKADGAGHTAISTTPLSTRSPAGWGKNIRKFSFKLSLTVRPCRRRSASRRRPTWSSASATA